MSRASLVELRRSRPPELVSVNTCIYDFAADEVTRCCPGGCSCVQQQNGYIGCCPIGSTCGGAVIVSTVTVTAQAQQTVPPVVVQDFTTTYNPYTQPPAAGFCQTLTMAGPDLPRVTQGQCGTILIVSESSRSWRPMGLGVAGVLLLTQLGFARIFHWI